MDQPKELKRKGRPPKSGRIEIDLRQLEALAAIQATQEEIGAVLGCTKRTLIKRLKEPEFLEAYENGKLKGRVNLRRLQMRHAQGLDANGKPVPGSSSAAVNMTIHMSKQPYWLNESDKSALEVNPIELVITRIERVIVDSSSNQNRPGLPPVIEAQAIQGR